DQVTVYEKSPHLGGRARSDNLDGCIVDTGAQLFGSGFSELFRFANEIGAGDLLVKAPGHDALYRNGRIHAISYGSVPSMVTSGALPLSLKLKLGAKYVPFLLRYASLLDASDPVAAGADWIDTESVAEWGRREINVDFVDLLAYPLLGAYYGSTPEDTSVAMYHSLAKAGLDVGVYAIKGGTGALFEACAKALVARGVVIEREREIRGIDDIEGDAVVLATPAHVAASLFRPSDALQQWLARVRYAPSCVLSVVTDRPIARDFFGLSLLRHDKGRGLVAVCNVAAKLPSLVPADRGLLVCLSAPDASANLLADPEAAVKQMLDALEEVLPGTRSQILRVKLYKHADAYPVFYPGYLKHLRRFPSEELPRNVGLAGDYLVAPTVEGALRSGARAIETLTL
ncbi:MAG TPA: FAD-dependent oxidoreductase, partial [Longimicrobiales bacterium]|nr:FAD-dependent oxidoreductase [Longimicrobiales bacterium]